MLVDVAVPEMSLSSLTYECPVKLNPGVRVIVPVQNHMHVGFVTGQHESPVNFAVKHIAGVIDDRCIIPHDIWNMVMYAGRVCFCGAGEALRVILPRALTDGAKINPPPEIVNAEKNFHERNYFNPFDDERVNFFVNELERPERTLILFPTSEYAKNFYSNLPEHIKNESLLYSRGNKLFASWMSAYTQRFRIVIASPAGVFAPLSPERIIIEDEASMNYIIPRLNISARSLAGHRAVSLGAELITAGRMPSLKTYIRTRPKESVKPERKNIILADIHNSKREEIHGIEGTIPLTFSLIKRTYKALMQNHNVIWILSRLGESSEVFCENCGHSVKCDKCGRVMKSMDDGNILWCETCRKSREFPLKCENCGYAFFKGRRPGLDALIQIVKKYYNDVHIYAEGMKKTQMHGLILSTHRGLELCSKIQPELIAWLDLDLELWRPDYNTRYNVFNMLYESYWRGRKRDSQRKILIQARKAGMKLANFLSQGWEKFITDELKQREEYMQPPYGYIIEIECSTIKRGEIIQAFDEAGIFVMDPGEDSQPLYVNVNSLDELKNVPELFRIRADKSLRIKLRSE
ncbi:MAG: hypothetical protein II884_01865 [Synergistaceae bacterium]|nr:hypothetical protein [Synergistaceae bacterium]